MTVVVASCTLAELFAGRPIKASDDSMIEGQLHLPEYQRPYRWGKEQVYRLRKDLCCYFKEDDKARKQNHLFYLGSIILHQQERGHRLNIIDGQQRLTTMALLACIKKLGSYPDLEYDSPLSQQQIRENLRLLRQEEHQAVYHAIDLTRINITLVVTRSEDDAYRFFETQNTGGVRLSGPDIIKAHHLRATPRNRQDDYARMWEALGDLNPLVDIVLKARCWNALDFNPLPSHRQPQQVREVVVAELAERTGEEITDVAYQCTSVTRTEAGKVLQTSHATGYAMRQPLNAGINTIHYLEYFERLRQRLLTDRTEPNLGTFHDFYRNLIETLDGCSYLKKLYDSTLLLYASHFGLERFFEAALRLFRVVYSPRVSNQKAVRESSVAAFVRDNPVFDWILMNYTQEQCMARLRRFEVKVSPENLEPQDNGVKKRFVLAVKAYLGLDLSEEQLAKDYDLALQKAIKRRCKGQEVSNA
ncbi:DUF262 domain-containing protein [Nitrosococcus wardiae]|uniref:DUF262 domain-containing protein n=1 Tax=Nitrosococcus wardiae TaxID=1814290 RepID=A0A4P7BTF4_9GAMM|nr:DUF262 domain-containing protein [Nitrosococcus wardiae]QBQ53153.1 DUF262 domain-containing protein [Nitrosococcus wardiae]